jgi:transcription elongation factor GreA
LTGFVDARYTTHVMANEEIYISRKGYQKLQDDLTALKSKRTVIAAQILEAREKGDLKENAEYHAAKEDSAHNERRISEIEAKLGGARILEDQGEIPSDKAYIGATVKVKDESGSEMDFTLVDQSESDPAAGRISITSPIGQALLGQAVDATVKVPVGKTGYKLTILNISRE